MTRNNRPPRVPQKDTGLWREISSGDLAGHAALFVDRDGVIVEDTGYLRQAADVRLLDGAAQAIARCNRLGIPVVVVTNQSGIARRLFDWHAFHEVQAALTAALALQKACLDAVLACGYHAEGGAPFNVADHPWRKPNPGMLLEAGAEMKLDLPHSWMVGDQRADIEAARAAGLEGGILVSPRLNHNDQTGIARLRTKDFRVHTSTSLAHAVSFLLECGRLGVGPSE